MCLDGLYLMEIDRVLRPGGYWVLSGPPISWKTNYKGWERNAKDLENEQINLEDLAKKLCWKKIGEKGPIAVWQKPTNHVHCIRKSKAQKSAQFCVTTDPDYVWLVPSFHLFWLTSKVIWLIMLKFAIRLNQSLHIPNYYL